MLLSPQDAEMFFKLHKALMYFVNQQLHVLPEKIASPAAFAAQSPEKRLKVREAFLKKPDLIDSFLQQNPANVSDEELGIVSSWKHQVPGKFYIFRELKQYTIFLGTVNPPIAYGVLALTQPYEELVGPHLPVLVETVLMPFKDKIIYDSLLNFHRISFGAGIRRDLNESFKVAKARLGIVASLPCTPTSAGKPTPKKRAKEKSYPADEVARTLVAQSEARLAAITTPFDGRWRITWMEKWDQGWVDAEVQGFLQFGPGRFGSFQFCYVRGDIECEVGTRDGKTCAEFSWNGSDENDPARGRGWAILDGDQIEGKIFIHRGDWSAFKATKIQT